MLRSLIFPSSQSPYSLTNLQPHILFLSDQSPSSPLFPPSQSLLFSDQPPSSVLTTSMNIIHLSQHRSPNNSKPRPHVKPTQNPPKHTTPNCGWRQTRLREGEREIVVGICDSCHNKSCRLRLTMKVSQC